MEGSYVGGGGRGERHPQRIWKTHGLKPHQVKRFKVSRDPTSSRNSKISSVCTCPRPSMRWCCVAMRRMRYRRLFAPSRVCRCSAWRVLGRARCSESQAPRGKARVRDCDFQAHRGSHAGLFRTDRVRTAGERLPLYTRGGFRTAGHPVQSERTVRAALGADAVGAHSFRCETCSPRYSPPITSPSSLKSKWKLKKRLRLNVPFHSPEARSMSREGAIMEGRSQTRFFQPPQGTRLA